MVSMNMSLPPAMRQWIEEQVAAGGYATNSEYFRDLIRREQKRTAEDRLESLLLTGLGSGRATDMTPREWQDIRHEVQENISKRQGA